MKVSEDILRVAILVKYKYTFFPKRLTLCSEQFHKAVHYSIALLVTLFVKLAHEVESVNCHDIHRFLVELSQSTTPESYKKIQQQWKGMETKTKLDKLCLQLSFFCYFPEKYEATLKENDIALSEKEFVQLREDFKTLTAHRVEWFLERLEKAFPNELLKTNGVTL